MSASPHSTAQRHCARQGPVHFAASAWALLAILLTTSAVRADQPLAPAALAKVKKATTYLRITLPDGSLAEGSGFFGVEPGLVLTNVHVLGMLRPESRLPRRIDIVLHSGEKNERSLAGRLLGIDRSSDLALLRVTDKDLPAPLTVASAKDLQETQEVFIFGFPFGSKLGKNITVSKSAVTSLRKNAFGHLNQVQVNGGINPGNSGGPVVDGKGNVVGVSVAMVAGAQIGFAVPGDYVHVILNGRITGLTFGQPYLDKGAVKVPVTMQLLDPLKRIQKTSLDFWAGDPGKPRPAETSTPKPADGDLPRQTVVLEYKNGVGRGELTLPAKTAKKVYWKQPVVVNGAGQTHWAAATTYQPGLPVQRKPVTLAWKYQPGRSPGVDQHGQLQTPRRPGQRPHAGDDAPGRLHRGSQQGSRRSGCGKCSPAIQPAGPDDCFGQEAATAKRGIKAAGGRCPAAGRRTEGGQAG